MDLSIANGLIADPCQGIYSCMNVGINEGKIAALSRFPIQADSYIEATGKVVCPAFIDIHLHEALPDPKGPGWASPIFAWAARMGVGTALGGNCGEGPSRPLSYLDELEQRELPVNVGMLAPHAALRLTAGQPDKYAPLNEAQLNSLRQLCEECLDGGCLGISLGLRYVPGVEQRELEMLGQVLAHKRGLLAVHLRDDAAGVLAAASEILELADTFGLRLQISHIGSMAAYGYIDEFLTLVDQWHSRGVDVLMDCYPYTAFSTSIGETTFDPGFQERYAIDYSALVVGEGEFEGQHLDEMKFDYLRREKPNTIIIAHVMLDAEVAIALTHPGVMVASDGFLHGACGHPRAAGSFPRFLRHYVLEKKLMSLYQGIAKITTLPARQLGLSNRGNLALGNIADITIFDPMTICDHANFQNCGAAPDGIEWVLLAGKVVCKQGGILKINQGKTLR